MSFRSAIPDFSLANSLYIGATVTFYGVDVAGNKTAIKPLLYAGPTGPQTVSNPQVLDGEGKFSFPVYHDVPLIAEIEGVTGASVQTGIIMPAPSWGGLWAPAMLVQTNTFLKDPVNLSIYAATTVFTTSGSIANDIALGRLELVFQGEPATVASNAAAAAVAAQVAAEAAAASIKLGLSVLLPRSTDITRPVAGPTQRALTWSDDRARMEVWDGSSWLRASGLISNQDLNLNGVFIATSAPNNSDAQLFYADYDCKALHVFRLHQQEDQSGTPGGGIRDAMFIEHVDNDTVNYNLVGQKISYALRAYVTGKQVAGVYQRQYKDLVAADFAAIGDIDSDPRGVSAITAQTRQYGPGIASHEFSVENPVDARVQSKSMSAVQAIVRNNFAASDATHFARGFMATLLGYRATSAFGATGMATIGIDLSEMDVSGNGIIMPQNGGNPATAIQYRPGEYSFYDIANKRFGFQIGATLAALIGQNGIGVGGPATYPFQVTKAGAPAYFASNDGADLMLIGLNGSGEGIVFVNGSHALSFHTSGVKRAELLSAGGLNLVTGNNIFINSQRVITARKTGWTVATGTATRTAFDTASVTTAQLAERVKALIDDLHSTAGHGLIGT